MTTQITTIDTNNYAEMAKAMGIAAEGESQKKGKHTRSSSY